MFEEFGNTDKPFYRWIDKNPSGFVLNVKKSIDSDYAVIHRADCYHLKDFPAEKKSGVHKSDEYFKVCAPETTELISWIENYRPQVIKNTNIEECEDCRPHLDLNTLYHEYNGIHASECHLPDYKSGRESQIIVNKYEREPKLRKECLNHYGYRCVVCGIDFKKAYGGIGDSPIQIHHLNPSGQTDGNIKIDPVKDLRPVCPNCHAVLHSGEELYTIEDAKEMLS